MIDPQEMIAAPVETDAEGRETMPAADEQPDRAQPAEEEHPGLRMIDALSAVLSREIAAIQAREFDALEGLFEEKSALVEKLEAEPPVPHEELRAPLEDLGALAQKDSALLERMIGATRNVQQEISRIRDRHHTAGVYGSEGKKREVSVARKPRLDTSY